MKIVLQCDESVSQHEGKASAVKDKAALRAILTMMKQGELLEDTAEAKAIQCPICSAEVTGSMKQLRGKICWSVLSEHLLFTHKVWTEEHERLGKALARAAGGHEKNQAPKKAPPRAPEISWDFGEAAAEEVFKEQRPPKHRGFAAGLASAQAERARGGRRLPVPGSHPNTQPSPPPSSTAMVRHNGHSEAPHRAQGVPTNGHGPAPAHGHPHGAPPSGWNGNGHGSPNGHQPPDGQGGGLFSSLGSIFSNLFASPSPDHSHPQGYGGANQVPGAPPQQPGPSPLGSWYPDPGLQARLVTPTGRTFDPGEVPWGRYQVEVFNGQSFVPMAEIEIVANRTYRLFLSPDRRLQWGEV